MCVCWYGFYATAESSPNCYSIPQVILQFIFICFSYKCAQQDHLNGLLMEQSIFFQLASQYIKIGVNNLILFVFFLTVLRFVHYYQTLLTTPICNRNVKRRVIWKFVPMLLGKFSGILPLYLLHNHKFKTKMVKYSLWPMYCYASLLQFTSLKIYII